MKEKGNENEKSLLKCAVISSLSTKSHATLVKFPQYQKRECALFINML